MVAPPQPILAPGGSENTRYLRRWGIHSTGSYGGTILSLTIIVLTMELEYFVFEASLVYRLIQHVYHFHHNACDTKGNLHWGLVWGLGSRLV